MFHSITSFVAKQEFKRQVHISVVDSLKLTPFGTKE
jgi:hypothetical protein